MNTNSSLRDKTQRMRREHILEAAVKVFAERGFHRSTIREVALAAGVSDGAIYNVFANKHDLLLGMFDPLDETSRVPPAAPPGGLDGLMGELLGRRWRTFTPPMLAMLRVVLSEVLVDRELRALFVERVIAPALALPEPVFGTLAARGELASTDIAMTLRLVTGGFLGLLLLRLLGDEALEARAAEVPSALADLLLDGLRPRPPKADRDAG